MAKVSWWSGRLAQLNQTRRGKAPQFSVAPIAPGDALSEVGVRKFLVQAGIPVVAAECVTDADGCRVAAAAFDGPVALKIVSADIAHKSDIGGVRLGVRGDENVVAAYAAILEAANKLRPRPHIEGILVAPMRTDGVELIVGITHDPDWGSILAVGFGGIFVEVFGEATLLRLPTTIDDIEAAIRSLSAAPLLQGARGRPATDLSVLARVVASIAALAEALGDQLQTLEVNPLYVRGDVIEALDGLITTKPFTGSGQPAPERYPGE